ncbi:hypothetical protein E2C01_001783 [Portunus trituberculatus]|uniref:Uncharacterized protein n=1 Tax=Portunus trituberculatus TaxID=210409 RepID=A0A5B7CIG9_PORTR|nr:hypothetical protein [Portunus trituberculatus]
MVGGGLGCKGLRFRSVLPSGTLQDTSFSLTWVSVHVPDETCKLSLKGKLAQMKVKITLKINSRDQTAHLVAMQKIIEWV